MSAYDVAGIVCRTLLNGNTATFEVGPIGRFRYIAWVKCPYSVAGKALALRAGKRA